MPPRAKSHKPIAPVPGADPTTPLMKQYWEIKRQHQDAILLFRLGDFYEMFYDDARTASRVLDITLTSRDRDSPDPVPLCGVPYHSAAGYVATLLDHGFKVAVCEQVEDPKRAKGIVRREVVRVITPGLRTDLEGLGAKEEARLAAVAERKGRWGLAWAEVASGTLRVTGGEGADELRDELGRLAPQELLVGSGAAELAKAWLGDAPVRVAEIEPWIWQGAEAALRKHFGVATLDAFGFAEFPEAAGAAGAILHYVGRLDRGGLAHLEPPRAYRRDAALVLDASTRENLELVRARASERREATLLGLLDETETAMGGASSAPGWRPRRATAPRSRRVWARWRPSSAPRTCAKRWRGRWAASTTSNA